MRLRRFLVTIALVLGALAASLATPDPVQAQSRTISLNQRRADLDQLVKQIGEATGRTILYDESVRGIVSIVAKRPVELEEAWAILDVSLSMLGYSLLPSTEGMWRIAKVAEAIGESPFVESPSSDREAYVTSLIPLRVADPTKVLTVLAPLGGARVTLVPFERTRSLIASGPERAIARLTTIADALDRVDEFEIRYRVLRYRTADEVGEWVEAAFDSGEISRRHLEVWSDERTNSLIYRGTEEETARLAALVDRVDKPVEGSGRIQVLRVLNREAGEVAELLQQLGDDSPQSAARGAPGPARATLASSDYSIAVDEASRSLIVRADPDAHVAIREMLETLDQPPQLIAVDITVTEVRTPKVLSLGFAFSIPLSAGDEQGEVIARLVSVPAGGGLSAGVAPETTLFGRVDQEIGLPFTTDDGTGVTIPINNTGVIEAGDIRAYTEVLIEPSLVVTSGDTHEIFVGDNVPVPVGGDSGFEDGSTSQGFNVLSRTTNIDRRDVGIKLTIDAQAGEDGPIQLDLDVEISRLVPSIAGDPAIVGPTFLEQQVVANARLNDGEAAIIAMNSDTRMAEGIAGTPWLSSLPVFGWLFTRKVERTEDVRLVLAAQARRVGSPAALAADTIRRRLAFERRRAQGDALPTVGPDEPAFAVLVTTRTRREDADAIAESLGIRGFQTEIHAWSQGEGEYWDVYVISLESMAEAAKVASTLTKDGWQTDIAVLPTRTRS